MHQIKINELLIKQITSVARSAGKKILEIYNEYSQKGHEQKKDFVKYKIDHSPLTQADLASHHCIIQELEKVTPTIPIVSEEDEASWSERKLDTMFWIIDPLDGTKEFVNESGEFTVNIALVENGISVFGVIFAPVSNEMYWGGQEIGSFREQEGVIEKINTSNESPKTILKIIASKSHLNSQTKDFITNLKFPHTLLQVGSSLKFCRIAEGLADIYPRFGPTCEWDTAAGQAILEGAGGCVQREDNTRLLYAKENVLNPYFIASYCSQKLHLA